MMNLTKTVSTLVGAGALAFSMNSHAVFFDFAAIADGDGTGYTIDAPATAGEGGYNPLRVTEDLSGLGVTATGWEFNTNADPLGLVANPAKTANYFAYLDKGAAGLGVCKNVNASDQCAPASDDNVTAGEVLRLVFDYTVTLSNISFVNGVHGEWFFDNEFMLSIDGMAATSDFLSADYSTLLTGQTFDFWLTDQSTSGPANQFYISNVTVPAPAPIALLALGLLGLYGASKKRKV